MTKNEEAKEALWTDLAKNITKFLPWINCKMAEIMSQTNATEMESYVECTVNGKKCKVKVTYEVEYQLPPSHE